ncbi:kielin/chordin-like protein [Andrena cerasifolii]|uniref:kielin/chordin-like protein n=1 Tax=Andrena cerasifolii TaxID=2819439 RepID=UPI004037F370
MMTTRAESRSFVQTCVFLTLLVAVHAAPQEVCDKTKCPGPLNYYQGLGCTPVYKNPGDCCAERYNCNHLKNLSNDKCYVNGHEYNIGDALREEDRNPCDVGCTCRKNYDGTAAFVCAIVDCFYPNASPNCYRRHAPDQCCPGPEICPEDEKDRATCEVDGKVYKDGEFFQPESDPENNCVCMPGYKGENVEPFCKKPNREYCNPLFRNAGSVHQNCVPVFYNNQDPQTDCSVSTRCQNDNDTVIHNHDSTKSSSDTDEDDLCRFGNMTMHRGDELNQGTDYSSVCVKCVCEVPPVPTCQRLPDSECDVTKHEPFTD